MYFNEVLEEMNINDKTLSRSQLVTPNSFDLKFLLNIVKFSDNVNFFKFSYTSRGRNYRIFVYTYKSDLFNYFFLITFIFI